MRLSMIILWAAVGRSLLTDLLLDGMKTINCKKDLDPDELSDKSSYYHCRDTGNVIYHSTRLRTPSKLEEAFLSDQYDISSDDWIEVSISKHQILNETRGVPYTGCLTFENATGGGLQASVSDTYGLGSSINLKFALLNAVVGKLSTSIGGGLGGSLTSTAEYFCRGSPGETLQLQLIQNYHIFRNSRWRKLTTKASFRSKQVLRGKWYVVPMLRAAVSSPTIKCVSDPTLLQCGSQRER